MSRICLCCGRRLDDDAPSYWHASCIMRFFGTTELPKIDLNEVILDNLARNSIAEGNAVTGVQKKLGLSFLHSKRHTVPYGVEYIIKTVDGDKPLLPEYEFVGMSLASLAGFATVPYGLLYSTAGEAVYITKRIDRSYEGGIVTKVPMEDFAQLTLTQTEYKYNGSYERCAKAVIDRYSATATLDKITFFRMVFFSYLIGNTDMHLKNFSLYKRGDGYSLAPFYDILPVLMVVNQTQMALTVHGKQTKLTHNDFLCFAESIGINEKLAKRLIKDILDKVDAMSKFIQLSPLPEDKQKALIALICERASKFELSPLE